MDNITFDFEIDAFGVHNELDGKKNVIYEIRTFMTAHLQIWSATEQKSEKKKQLFITHLPVDNLNNFVEYENVTKEIALSWIEKYSTSGFIDNFKQKLKDDFYPKQQYLKPNF